MSYRFADSLWAGSGWNILILHSDIVLQLSNYAQFCSKILLWPSALNSGSQLKWQGTWLEFGRICVQIYASTTTVWGIWWLRSVHQQPNTSNMPQIKTWPLPSTSFTIRWSLITPSLMLRYLRRRKIDHKITDQRRCFSLALPSWSTTDCCIWNCSENPKHMCNVFT